MQSKGFRKPTLDEVRAKMAQKREKALKATKVPKSTKNSLKGQNLPKKRKKKTERKAIEDKLWELCKKITRERHGNTCFTCGAQNLIGSNWHTGHGKPKGALPIIYKYDLRNLRPQCYNCNMNYGGMSDIFIAKLELEPKGLEFLNEACIKTDEGWKIKQVATLGGKDATIFLNSLLSLYKLGDC
jgi:hypothetical protein